MTKRLTLALSLLVTTLATSAIAAPFVKNFPAMTGGGGGGAVSSVSSGGGCVTFSPTTGAVIGTSTGCASTASLATIATSGSASDLATGTLPSGRFPALTGDITTTAGSLTTQLAATVGGISGGRTLTGGTGASDGWSFITTSNATKGVLSSDGVFRAPLGSAAAAAYSFTGLANYGMYTDGAQLFLEVSGSALFKLRNNGRAIALSGIWINSGETAVAEVTGTNQATLAGNGGWALAYSSTTPTNVLSADSSGILTLGASVVTAAGSQALLFGSTGPAGIATPTACAGFLTFKVAGTTSYVCYHQ